MEKTIWVNKGNLVVRQRTNDAHYGPYKIRYGETPSRNPTGFC